MQQFAHLNREQLRDAAQKDALVILPIGATEQHGPHLATGTDWFAVDAIAHEAARRASIDTIVTPALPFGSSHHHFIFGGTLSLSTETYLRVLKELLESLANDGFRHAFLLNGHGGNHELAELAARDVALQRQMNIGAASYWALAWDALIEANAHQGRRLPGHAGDFETSLMMALRPDLTPQSPPRRDQPESSHPRWWTGPFRAERHGAWQAINGFTDSPANATAAQGQAWFDIICHEVAQAFTGFYNAR